MSGLTTARRFLASAQFRLLLRGMMRRVPRWLLRRSSGYLFERATDSRLDIHATRLQLPDAGSFAEIHPSIFAPCARVTGLGEHEVRRRYEGADRCFGILVGSGEVGSSQLINLSWLHFGSCYVRGLGLRLDLDQTDCYLYGAVTAPEHRGKGLYRWTQRELLRIVATLGRSRIVQLVEDGNEVPLHVLPQLGYRLFATVRHVTILGIKWTVVRHADGRIISRQLHMATPADVFWI